MNSPHASHPRESLFQTMPSQVITEVNNKVWKAVGGGSRHCPYTKYACQHGAAAAAWHFTWFLLRWETSNGSVLYHWYGIGISRHSHTLADILALLEWAFLSVLGRQGMLCTQLLLKSYHFHMPPHMYAHMHLLYIHCSLSVNLLSWQKFLMCLNFVVC